MDNHNSLEQEDMDNFTKGSWLTLEADKKRKTEADLLEKLAEKNRKEREAKTRTKPAPDPNNSGCVKLLRDWQQKYYHS